MVRVVLHYGPTSIFILSTHLEIQALKHGNKTDFLMLDPVLNTPELFMDVSLHCTRGHLVLAGSHPCVSTNQPGVNFLFVNFEYVECKLGLNHKPTV